MKHVKIRVQGCLDQHWAEWLEGFTITYTENEETLLVGDVPDQAAFYGIIGKLRDLGVKLIAARFGNEILKPEPDRDANRKYPSALT